jgi:ABC-type proline/glycine betaine transport system ATPase subunit
MGDLEDLASEVLDSFRLEKKGIEARTPVEIGGGRKPKHGLASVS